LIAKASGDFFDTVKKENIFLYREHVRVPFVASVEKINEDYYFYGQLSNKIEGNYSLAIENTRYFILDQLKNETIFANFTISNLTADFSVIPGIVRTNKSFEMEFKNLKTTQIVIGYSFSNISSSGSGGGFFSSLFGLENSGNLANSDEITLNPGQTKKVEIEIGDFSEPALINLNAESDNTEYNIPVYIFPFSSSSVSSSDIYFETAQINLTIPTNSETTRTVYIANNADTDVEVNFTLSESLKPYVSLSKNSDEINSNSSLRVDLTFYSETEEFYIEGKLEAGTEERIISIPIYFYSVKGFIPSENETSVITNKFCSELNGTICSQGFQCDSETKNARDGVCCLGMCVEQKESSIGKWIGWILLVVLILIAIWFYLSRYKNIRGVSDLTKVLGRR
jgi:hypothetical protein